MPETHAVLSWEDLRDDPDLVTATLRTARGDAFTARLLHSDDGEALGRFFESLTEAVTGMYRPHPLTAAHARQLCAELDYAERLPWTAWVEGDDGGPAVAAYFLVQPGVRDGDRQRYVAHGAPLSEADSCLFAPCVADAWLSRGLGSALLPHVVDGLRRLGFRHIVLQGGVRGDNPRAQHFYRKHGFRHVGDFPTGDLVNHDMVLDL